MEQRINQMLVKSERTCYLTLGVIIGIMISSAVFSLIYLINNKI